MPQAPIRLALLLTGITALQAAPALAQSPRPAPSLNAPAQPTPSPVIPTLKANVQLVVVDVVVTDSKQAPVHNLKASDFVLTENNSPQQITNFEEHSVLPPGQAAKIPPMRPLPPGIFTNFTPTPPTGAINVLLLDALNTQMKDQSYVRDQLREFLKNTPEGTRIAIFVLNDRLIMLQGFTSDLSLLKSVVERSIPASPRLLTDSTGKFDNVGNGGTAVASDVMSDIAGPDIADLISEVKQAEAVQATMSTLDRTKMTLDAMNQLAHYLSGIQGRKNLIWFSGSFPLTIFPDSGINHPFDVVASSEDEFRETTSLLARAQVAVYPIDARGLRTRQTAIANDSSQLKNSGLGLTMAQNKSFQDEANDHVTMNQMAEATGGHAFLDTNGLSEAATKAIDSGSNYYTLAYTPTDSRQNGEFHKIQVKLAQQGLTLTYRTGYFADDSNNKRKLAPDAATSTIAHPTTLTRVMMRGAPPPAEILLKLQILPASTAQEEKVVPGNLLNPNSAGKAKVKGPFHRYAIDIAADAKDIQITPTPDGHYQFSTEVLTYVYDANGVVVNSAAQKARGNLSLSTYANMRRTGLPFHQEISVPVNGDYYLRTSVHDLETDRYGAVEIPIASVAKLTPLTAAAAPPK